MRVKYFSDTDTALVEFTDNEVAETKEISENIYVDLDGHGNLVSMTIEHARTNARLQVSGTLVLKSFDMAKERWCSFMMPSDQDFHGLGDGLGLFGEEGNRGEEIEFCDLPPGSRKLQVARKMRYTEQRWPGFSGQLSSLNRSDSSEQLPGPNNIRDALRSQRPTCRASPWIRSWLRWFPTIVRGRSWGRR